jgi:hypothetical protein
MTIPTNRDCNRDTFVTFIKRRWESHARAAAPSARPRLVARRPGPECRRRPAEFAASHFAGTDARPERDVADLAGRAPHVTPDPPLLISN